MKATGIVGILIALCAVLCECQDTVHVSVDAFPMPDPALARTAALCFVPPTDFANLDLPKRVQYQEIISQCAAVARVKGYVVLDQASGQCLRTSVGWVVSGGARYTGSDTSCISSWSPVIRLAATQCTERAGYESVYTKTLRFYVFDSTGARQLYQADASLVSGIPEFRQGTTIALCRAVLQDFPRRVNGGVYEANTALD